MAHDEKDRADARGCFAANGGFYDSGDPALAGQTDALTRALVAERRQGRLTPEKAARAVLAANAAPAFPNIVQWQTIRRWSEAWTTTSAEEAVKHEGRGSEGHWCGERFAPGTERDCPEPGHKMKAQAGDARAFVRSVIDSLHAMPSVSVYREDE